MICPKVFENNVSIIFWEWY